MYVAIVGAGSVGLSIATELLDNGHDVTVIDLSASLQKQQRLPNATWIIADACESSTFAAARMDRCDVVVAATGDDKVNLVASLLAKTEYGVGRTVARISNPRNEWMFTSDWGVDVAVSTPRLMTALVEEAVSEDNLVRILTFHQTQTSLVELKLGVDSPVVGEQLSNIGWPQDCILVGIIRDARPQAPTREHLLEVGDELVFICDNEREAELSEMLSVAGLDL